MAIIHKVIGRPQIDLTGPNGNAFVLLGTCQKLVQKLQWDWQPIQEDAMSGDYEHLVSVLDKHFGKYVDFIR